MSKIRTLFKKTKISNAEKAFGKNVFATWLHAIIH